MMKKILLLLLLPAVSLAQQSHNDSLKKALKTARTDAARYDILLNLAVFNEEINRDTALYYYDQSVLVAKKNNQRIAEAVGLRGKGYMFHALGRFPESLACFQQALKLAEDPAAENQTWDPFGYHNPHKIRLTALAVIHLGLGDLMVDAGDLRQALFEHKLGKQLAEDSGQQWVLGLAYMNLGYNYFRLNQPDSALIMNQNAARIFEHVSFKRYLGYVYESIANINLKKGNAAGAVQNFHKALRTDLEQKNLSGVAFCYSDLTGYYLSAKQKDSSLYYARKTIEFLHFMASTQNLDQAYDFLYQSYKLNGKTDSAYKYQGLALSAKDSVFKATTKSLTDFQKLSFKAQIHAQELEKEKAAIQTRIRTYVLLAGIGVLMLLAGIFYRNNRQKQKANVLLSRQKEEIEAQARESQIEAALERVRSRTVAMQKSEELGEVIQVIFEQFVQLNFHIDAANFALDYRESDDFNIWVGTSGQTYPAKIHIPYIDHPLMNLFVKAKIVQQLFAVCLTFEQKNTWFKYFFEFAPDVTEERKEIIFSSRGMAISTMPMTNVALSIYNYAAIPYSDAENATIVRFGKVFAQTYTRFKDLEQAEEQAREAKIEAALERVRSRTMAMQKSEELAEAIQLNFEQFVHLGFKVNSATFNMDYRADNNSRLWIASSYVRYPSLIYTPYFDHPVFNIPLAARDAGSDHFVTNPTFSEKNEFFDHFFKNSSPIPDAPADVLDRIYNSPGYYSYGALFKTVSLTVTNYLGYAYTEAEEAVIMRFGKVFEQTYTRFNDLQKAEAQAREAQIEAALEKVRSRSLAMHKSDELIDVVKVVFERLQELSFGIDGAAFIVTPGDVTKEVNIWIGDNHAEYPSCFRTPFFDAPVITDIFDAVDSGQDFFSKTYAVNEKNPWFEYAFKHTDYKYLPEELRSWILAQENLTQCFALAKNSGVGIHFHNRRPLSENETDILKRFSKVFEQSYIRFLDLQKAEAQAREAQIEAALERVRSRTMAMQKSDELREVIQLIYEQFVNLGMDITDAGFTIDYKESDDWHLWHANAAHSFPSLLHIPYFDHPQWNRSNEAKRKGLDFFANTLTFEEKNSFFEQVFENAPDVSKEVKELVYSAPGYAISNVFLKNVSLYIDRLSTVPFSEADNAVLKRFAKVFEQTYTRFKDLEQAEEQAREAKIEAALERVRSRTMGMQKSGELADVIQLTFEQFVHLGFNINSATFNMDHLADNNFRLWAASSYQRYPSMIFTPYFDHPVFNIAIDAKKSGADHYKCNLTAEEKKQFWDFFFKNASPPPQLPPDIHDRIYNSPGYYSYTTIIKTVSLTIVNYSGYAYTETEEAVVMRFGKVFEQTYTRFKDLEQAEEQARESQIQLALERVRARTMAMRKSEELKEVIQVVFDQLYQLNFNIDSASFDLNFSESDDMNLWIAVHDSEYATQIYVPFFDHPLFNAYNKNKVNGQGLYTPTASYEEKNSFYECFFEYTPGISDDRKQLVFNGAGYANTFVYMKNIILSVANYAGIPYSDSDNEVIKRFAAVFEQTYTRFNDLKQAEEQAREAKIEAALERVRSRTMAMQKSEELAEVIQLTFDQFVVLNFNINAANFDNDIGSAYDKNIWLASSNRSYPARVFIPYFDHPVFNIAIEAGKNGSDHVICNLTADETKQFWGHFFKNASPLPEYPPEIHDRIYNSPGYYSYTAIMKTVSLTIVNYSGYAYSESEEAVIMRFGKVFAQTYTRFKDLEQAEEQAREAKIEAALERVRGKAMAMYNSADLTSTASMVFTELRKLGINPIRCGVGMINNQSRKAALYSATSSIDGDSLGLVGWVMLEGHPVLDKIYGALVNNEEYYPVLKGKQLKAYYGKLLSGISLPTLPDFHPGEEHFGHFFPFPDGSLYAWSERRYDETEIRILRRFASVIDLTFRRYNELQRSETSAREVVRAASLDRVRAEIASMRSTYDLDKITPLIWNELTILGIAFIRCGVFIVDEPAELIHTHLSTFDGKALATFDLPFDSEGISQNVMTAWRNKNIATIHWTKEEFTTFTTNLVQQGSVRSQDRYVTEHPDTSLDLHFFPFLQGMLYVGNATPLTNSEKELVQSLAEAFSTAYARYEDFNKLEAAKQQVDKTLTELKAAQTQLIQTEKMASLGELTAGIAHEIQNPLNFVNNFSEVNAELIGEMKEEIQKGDLEEVLALALDIEENSKKINMHGKRADGIVKGMLQHSQSGSGAKEPTNINSLADEYMRLAYHGLRAKDKSFNAEMVTHFDPDLPKVNVIGQDIGRVMLNLFNNAFYAVSKKQKTAGADYKPEVTVTTSIQNGQVIIKVKDNGIGIPDAIKEKIMQPFFTTKPTGEGTGLGLSLTYDMVVKGHGGSIDVNTKERGYTEFIIKLPVK